RVLESGGSPDDEVSEMRSHRSHMRQSDPVLHIAHNEAGAARHPLALVARIPHAPIKANALAVDAMASLVGRFPDSSPGPPALGRIAIPDLGVHGDAAFTHAFALVGSLRGNRVTLEKWRPGDGHLLRHPAALLH